MLVENIKREVLMIDDNVECAKILLQKCRQQTPDIYDTLAAGSLLQTYYNGLENVFKMINNDLDKIPLAGQGVALWRCEQNKIHFFQIIYSNFL